MSVSRSEYRRLVKVGNSIYVSLPRGWVESKGLGSGSVVAAEVVEGGLLLKPLKGESEKAKAKRIEGGSARDVIKAYLAGYEVIEVEKPPKDLLKGGLERLLKLLVGLEVVDESDKKLVLQCFVKDGYDVKGVLSRMDSISRSMYIDASAALESGDTAALESVRSRDDRLDRLYFLAVRLIRSAIQSPVVSGQERLFLVDARLVAKLLEEIGDEAERMTYSTPASGLTETAKVVARCQEAVIFSFLRERAEVGCAEVLQSISNSNISEGARNHLYKISKLVMDLSELI
jgi:phosphate uptake regulator